MTGRPIIGIAVSYVAGALLAVPGEVSTLALAAGLCIAWLVMRVIGALRALAFARAFPIAAACAVLGCYIMHHDGDLPPRHPSHLLSTGPVLLSGYAASPLAAGTGLRRFVLRASEAAQGGQSFNVDGCIVVNTRLKLSIQPGQRVAVQGPIEAIAPPMNPGQFDAAAFYLRRWRATQEVSGEQIAYEPDPGGPVPLIARVAAVKFRLRERIRATMPRPSPSLTTDLLLSAVIGLRAVELPEAVEESFRRSGTVHVLVVSGSQVGIVCFVGLLLIRSARRQWRWAGMILCAPLLAGYVLLVGPEPSVVRATIMAALAVGAFSLRRDYDAPSALAAAALLVGIAAPMTFFDIGFELSVAAVAGIVFLVPTYQRRLEPGRLPAAPDGVRHSPKWLGRVIVRAGVATWLTTTPILLLYFRQAPLFSIVANLAIVPAAAALTVLGAMSCLFVSALPGWSWCLNYASSILVEAMVRYTDVCASQTWAVWQCGEFTWAHVVLWYAALLACDHLLRKPRPEGGAGCTPREGSRP